MYDYEIENSFNSKKGIGIRYEYNGEQYISVCSEKKRKVYVSITSFMYGGAIGAEHYYGKLEAYGLGAKQVGEEDSNMVSYTPNRPEEMGSINVEITYVSEKDVYKKGMFSGVDISIKKGERTPRFDNLQVLKKRVMEELVRLFPESEWEWVIDEDAFEDEVQQ